MNVINILEFSCDMALGLFDDDGHNHFIFLVQNHLLDIKVVELEDHAEFNVIFYKGVPSDVLQRIYPDYEKLVPGDVFTKSLLDVSPSSAEGNDKRRPEPFGYHLHADSIKSFMRYVRKEQASEGVKIETLGKIDFKDLAQRIKDKIQEERAAGREIRDPFEAYFLNNAPKK